MLAYRSRFSPLRTGAIASALIASVAPASASEWGTAIEPSATLITDVVTVARGERRGTRVLQVLQAAADIDLAAAGLAETRASVGLLATAGAAPNDLAGTLQGVDNGEVGDSRLKLYELWFDRSVGDGRAQLLLGLRDLNAEFYQNDSAGLLVAPAFGIGSELAATGPNGPSVFPSTALTARVRVVPRDGVYVQAAAVNAQAGTLGDPGGVDLSMGSGALLIAEAGLIESKLAVGYWRYTKHQPDIADDMRRRRAQGAYLLVDHAVRDRSDATSGISLFARLGFSDGDTTPYRGGWQAGLLVERPFAARPDSRLSFGVNQAYLSKGYRSDANTHGTRLSPVETGIEATYSDRIAPGLTIQPDLQYIRRPFRDASERSAIVAAIRFTLSAPSD